MYNFFSFFPPTYLPQNKFSQTCRMDHPTQNDLKIRGKLFKIDSAGWILRNLHSTRHFNQKVRRDAELSLALQRRRITL